jgi:spermidine synthase
MAKQITVTEWSDQTNVLKYTGQLVAEHAGQPQNWVILDNQDNGQMLFINGQHQSSLSDERLYHETIVHSLLHGLREPENVLILGGAEGCMLREVLKYPSVKSVIQIDWDNSLVAHFKSDAGAIWNDGAYSDPRVTYICDDAMKWLERSERKFDAIFIDLLDPSSETIEFLQNIILGAKKCLAQGGGIILNAGIVKKCEFSHAVLIAEYMTECFPGPAFHRVAIHREIPSYLGHWGFFMVVPRTFSHTFLCRQPLVGLTDFSVEKFVQWTQWGDGYYDVFRRFWRDEKLVVAAPTDLVTRVFEHHGC